MNAIRSLILLTALVFVHPSLAGELLLLENIFDSDPGLIRVHRFEDGVWSVEDFFPAADFNGNYAAAAALTPEGRLWLAWSGARGAAAPEIYFSVCNGGVWSRPRPLGPSGAWESEPALAADERGRVRAAWSRRIGPGMEVVTARWEGGFFGPPEVLSSGTAPNVSPALAAGGGEAMVVWQGLRSGRYRIFFSLYSGGTWSEAEPVAAATADQVRPDVFINYAGDWEARWTESGRERGAVFRRGSWRPLEAAALAASASEITLPDIEGEISWLVAPGRAARYRRPAASPRESYAAASTAADTAYLGYGDSITWGTYDSTRSYVPLLQYMLNEENPGTTFDIRNGGYPAATTRDLLYGPGHKDWPCPGIEEVLDEHSGVSKLLLMAGTNDIRNWFDPSETRANLGMIIWRAREKGVEPVLATIIPNASRPGQERQERTEILNRDYIRPLAAETFCRLADPFQVFLDYGNWRELLIDDGIHPTFPGGAKKIADAWFSALTGPSPTAGELEWYLPAGETEHSDTYILVANPNQAAAEISIQYVGPSGHDGPHFEHTVSANSRFTVKVNDNRPDRKSVGAIIRSLNEVGVIVERSMYRPAGAGPGGWIGGHNTIGLSETSTRWYLAEGATHHFDMSVHLLNAEQVNVDATVSFQDPTDPAWSEHTSKNLDPESVWTVRANDIAPGRTQLSVRVEAKDSDHRIAVDRTMYFPLNEEPKGGHASVGVKSPKPVWHFAEGATHLFDQYIMVHVPGDNSGDHPGDETVKVRFIFRDQSGPVGSPVEEDVKPGRRFTLKVNDVVGHVSQVAARVEAVDGTGILAERAMYRPGGSPEDWELGHSTIGAQPSFRWHLPEGSTLHFDTYLMIMNTCESQPAAVNVSFMTAGGALIPHSLVIPPLNRATVNVNGVVPDDAQVSMTVVSDRPVVAERAMYWPRENWKGAHATIGYSPSPF